MINYWFKNVGRSIRWSIGDGAARGSRPRDRFRVLVTIALVTLVSIAQSARADDPVARDIATSIGMHYPLRNTSGESPIVDLNGDGLLDIVLSGHMWFDWPVLINKGGVFDRLQSLPDRGDRCSCTSGDFNRDGRTDLYCCHGACEGRCSKEFPNELFLQLSNGLYSVVNALSSAADARTVAKKWGVADVHGRGREPVAIDFNKDGRLDIALANNAPSIFPAFNRLFKNVGGKFTEVIDTPIRRESASECVEAADINDDGWIDLVFCSNNTPHILTYRNNNGKFQDISLTSLYSNEAAREIRLADVNGDSMPNLLIVAKDRFTIWLNDSGVFTAPHFSYPLSDGRYVAVGDVNKDNMPDAYLVQGSNSKYQDIMLIADVGGTAYHTTTIPQATVGDGDAAFGYPDWNGSGRTAFLVQNGRLKDPGPVQFIAFFGDGE